MNLLIKTENNFQIKKENKYAVLINLINQNRMININPYSIRFSKIINTEFVFHYNQNLSMV